MNMTKVTNRVRIGERKEAIYLEREGQKTRELHRGEYANFSTFRQTIYGKIEFIDAENFTVTKSIRKPTGWKFESHYIAPEDLELIDSDRVNHEKK